ncbi:MAG: Fe-S cluster assembly protein SufD [Acidimicrobiaceae bacterium]|jgi:Fe-S cluster assembly protein SufD
MTAKRVSLADAARALGGLPTAEEEVWRYSRIDELDLDAFACSPPVPVPPADAHELMNGHIGAALATVPERAATVVLADGGSMDAEVDDPDITVTIEETSTSEHEPTDVFFRLNDELARQRVIITVPAGKVIERPIVVAHWISTSGIATFPRTVVRLGEGAHAQVVEYHASPDDVHALTMPVVELDVAQAAVLGYVNAQNLGLQTWQLASQVSRVERDATLTSALAGFGGDYARQRTDCRLVGRGATGNLLAVYFGEEDQTLDFRTFQDHAAPDTTSNLLFKGAVGGHSRSVYTGLIRVRKNARGTNAIQTNRNIKLSEHAWAESVPNLEIENNDVRCAHASAVGPIDEDQRFYLESRGVPTPIAERLVVTGFFDEVLSHLPVTGAGDALRTLVAGKLDRQVGGA